MSADESARKMLHVLQVSAFFPRHGGGIEVVAGELAARLPAQQISVRWMAGGPADERPSPMPGVAVDAARSWDPLERRLGLPFPLWSPASLARLWRQVGLSAVIHVHDFLYLPMLAAMLFAALRGRPVVLTQHIGEIPYRSAAARRLLATLNRRLGAFVLGRVGQAVFVGLPVQQYFERFVRFRHPPLLVPNGVDHIRFRAGTESAGGPLRLLFVGRFVEKKGLHLLRGCLDMPDAQWTFVGAGPLAPEAGPRITLAGRRTADEVADLLRAADLLVLPSTGEGFPLVVQEALACGTPVLVSTEVFEAFPQADERCVFHAELRGADAASKLRGRLEGLRADMPRLRAARPAAAALARQWDWDATARRYAEIYRRLALVGQANADNQRQ